MKREIPLVEGEYLLLKFPGKGGWTYAEIPEVLQNKNNPFGWVKVKGSIDNYEFRQHKLMPMGNGKLFLPVKSEIRKEINKGAGDYVKVILFSDASLPEIPDEILECFENEPGGVLANFQRLSEGDQKSYLDWIYDARSDDTKARRILKMMNRLARNLSLYDKKEL